MDKEYKIAYVISDLKNVGPTNQTFNIINYSKYKKNSIVITLFDEPEDSKMKMYLDSDIKVECLHINRKIYFLFAKALKSKLEELNPDIVHSYGVKSDYLCYKVCRKLNIKHIITLRNFPKEDIPTRMNYISGKIALHQHLKSLLSCENVICCSKTISSKMTNEYKTTKFKYIQNGVNTEKYFGINDSAKRKLRSKLKIDNNFKVFICTNSFIPRKRIDETINIFNKIKIENKLLLLFGSGMLFDELKDKYESDNIKFMGKKNNIIEYLQISDYFISTSESEGLPNAVLEAIACGIPVILSNIPQHIEIFETLKYPVGICYELGNIEDFIKKFNLVTEEKYKLFKSNTKVINYSDLTMKNMSKKYVDYYEKVGDINE